MTREPSQGEKLPFLLLRMCPESWESLSRWRCLEQAREVGEESGGIRIRNQAYEGWMGEEGTREVRWQECWTRYLTAVHSTQRGGKLLGRARSSCQARATSRSPWRWGKSLISLICSRIKGRAESDPRKAMASNHLIFGREVSLKKISAFNKC